MHRTALAAFLFAAACNPTLLAQMPSTAPADVQPVTQVSQEIRGNWLVIEIRDDPAKSLIQIDPNEPEMTISFEEGSFGLSAGCNAVGGHIFARDGDHNVVGNVFSTTLLCAEAFEQQERRLARAFPEDGHYLRVTDYLYLFSKSGQLMLTLLAAND